MRTTLLTVLVHFVFCSQCLSIAKPPEVVHNPLEKQWDLPLQGGFPTSSGASSCDISGIPAMDGFDMEKFSGSWYELAKTVSGYIDADDGMWKIMINNASNERYKFVFSGRDANGHCVRPIPGLIEPVAQNPGEIILKYRTYSTQVSETFRVLFTDYDNFAAVYSCVYINEHTHECHPGGIYGSIWSRKDHVQHSVFDKAAEVLKKACIDKNTLRIRLLKGPCKVDDLGTRDEMITVPNICYLPVSPGSCEAHIKRYYFNEYEKNCHEFEFTGCGGNHNNFFTKNECANQCMQISSKDAICKETSICYLACPPCCREVSGGCVKCSCESIIVDHFANCFRDEFQCPEECHAEEKYPGCFVCVCEEYNYPDAGNELSPVCLEVKEKGKCSDRQQRFYFSVRSNRCEKFNYTGCGGNKNNFGSLEQCQKECKGGSENILRADHTDKKFGEPDGVGRTSSTCYTSFLCIIFSILWLR